MKTQSAKFWHRIAIIVGITCGLFVLAAPAEAKDAGPVFVERTGWQPFDFETNNFCQDNNEGVSITGQTFSQLLTTEDASGAFHTEWVEHIRGMGVGLETGAKYVFMLHQSIAETLPIAGASTSTASIPLRLISLDTDVPDAHVKALFHVTVDANGNLRSDIFEFEFVCL